MLPALPSCLIISEPTPSATATQNPRKDTGGVGTNPHGRGSKRKQWVRGEGLQWTVGDPPGSAGNV